MAAGVCVCVCGGGGGYTMDVRIILFLNALEIDRRRIRMAITQVYRVLFMER
jgi:hypothetical protein